MPLSSGYIKSISIAEYLLLIQPRKDLSDAIMDIKQSFYDKYKAPEAIKGRPHITLVNFVQYTGYEERIRHRLRNLAITKAPVCIELMDYGSFPSHTIYINIISRLAVQNLVKNIRTEMQQLLKLNNDNKPHFILEPHLTIARKLKPWQYEKSWLEFTNKNFSGKFIANNMILLKKAAAETKYSIVEKFEFQNIPVAAKQVQLF